MITSAPFDNWWHAAYGLDVKIVSPPHTLLILGIRAVAVGILFLILAAMNRAMADDSPPASGHQDTAASLPLRRRTHRLRPDVLPDRVHLGRPAALGDRVHRHGNRAAARLRHALPGVAIQVGSDLNRGGLHDLRNRRDSDLPLFPAQPKLGPVFNPVTHLVPAKFPILIFVPALALDLLWQRTRAWKPWKVALVSGFLFIAVLTIVEWPFANFLLSKASENRFFGTIYFDYNSRPNGYDRLRLFFHPDHGLILYFGLLRAAIYASIGTWIGLSFGRWMRSVQR